MSVNPSKSSVYFQKRNGEQMKRLPLESIVSAPSGAGFNFDSDYAAGTYLGTRRTANEGRVTMNLQTRREAISILRDLIGDGLSLFGLAVLESDSAPNPTWQNFTLGNLYLDCGLTSRATSASLADSTGVIDPKQLDTMGFTAGKWVEVKPVSISQDIAIATNGLSTTVSYYCAVHDYSVLTKNGTTEITIIGGSVDGTLVPAMYYTYSRGDKPWSAVDITGLPAATTVRAMVITNNRLIIATDSGIYHTSLYTFPGTTNWTLANGIVSTDAIADMISPEPGVVFAISSGASVSTYWYSTDDGFSFTEVVVTGARTLTKCVAAGTNLIFISSLGVSEVIRVRGLTAARSETIPTVTGTFPAGTYINALAIPPGRTNELYAGASNGALLRCKSSNATTMAWEFVNYANDSASGSPIVLGLNFAPDGSVLWMFCNNGLMLDYSSGFAGSSLVAALAQSISNSRFKMLLPLSATYAIALCGDSGVKLVE